MQVAFAGPAKIAARMGSLDVHRIAKADPDGFAALAADPPAIHRYARSMAARIQALARVIGTQYGGDAARIWTDPLAAGLTTQAGPPDAQTVLTRLRALPGFGDQKSRIFLALLAKQYGVQPDGWQDSAGTYGEQGARRSIADVTDAASLAEVRAAKKAAKAAAHPSNEEERR